MFFWLNFNLVILYLMFKKKFVVFFFETNVFNFRIYAIRVFALDSRYFVYWDFRKIHEFLLNFNFVFLLILANDCQIELIVFYIFNQNCDFAYRDRFSILFLIYYQTLLIRENDINYVLTFFKYKYFIFLIYIEIVFFQLK